MLERKNESENNFIRSAICCFRIVLYCFYILKLIYTLYSRASHIHDVIIFVNHYFGNIVTKVDFVTTRVGVTCTYVTHLLNISPHLYCHKDIFILLQ